LGAEVRYRGREFKTRTIETGGHNAEKLILIHGVGGHAEAYSRNLHRLGERYHAIAIDLVWHGLSAKPPFTKEMVPTYARQIIDLIDDLGARKASIEGESLGGWVTMYTALNYTDRVEKIILNTTAGVRWKTDEVKIDHAGGTNTLRERSLAAIKNPTRDTIRKRLEWLMASPDRVTDELVDLRTALYSRPDTNASLTNVFANSFAGHGSIPEDDIRKIRVPTLVLWSDKNPGTGPDAGKRLSALIPNASFHCVNDAAHWPQWEQPEDHDRAVLAFLDGKLLGESRTAASAAP